MSLQTDARAIIDAALAPYREESTAAAPTDSRPAMITVLRFPLKNASQSGSVVFRKRL